MLAKHFAVLLAVLVFLFSTAAMAQKADVAFVVGGSFVSDSNVVFTPPCVVPPCTISTLKDKVQAGHQVFLEGALAFRLLHARVSSLHLEVPVAGPPSQEMSIVLHPPVGFDHLSSVFVSPAFPLKYCPCASI